MDKLIQTLKNRILTAYGNFVRKAQKGYPLDNYSNILEAMLALDYIDSFLVSEEQQIKIIDYYILKLSND